MSEIAIYQVTNREESKTELGLNLTQTHSINNKDVIITIFLQIQQELVLNMINKTINIRDPSMC